MKAKDVMTTELLTVTADTSVEDIARLMLEHRISAVPVTDGQDGIVGIVSEGDLIRRPEIGTDKGGRAGSWSALLFGDLDEPVKRYIHSHGRRAGEIMSDRVITVDEEASLAEIVRLLEKHHIKRVPVLRDKRLVGLVSRANLVRALSAVERHAPELPDDDRVLRDQIMAALSAAGVRTNFVTVIVQNGRVDVWGSMDSEAQHEAARLAIEEIVPAERVDYQANLLPQHLRGMMGGL